MEEWLGVTGTVDGRVAAAEVVVVLVVTLLPRCIESLLTVVQRETCIESLLTVVQRETCI